MKTKEVNSGSKVSASARAGKEKPTTKTGKKRKMKKVMDEWKHGELKMNGGKVVEDQKQAIAIALSESGQSYKDKKSK